MSVSNLLRQVREGVAIGLQPLRYVAIGLIRLYQFIHPAFFRGSCRFEPTCSHYGIDAMKKHGLVLGTLLTMARIFRCQPFFQGGYDPVPDNALDAFKRRRNDQHQTDFTQSTLAKKARCA